MMDPHGIIDLGRDAMWIMLIISAPTMVIGVAVGLLVAIFMAITQLQEQTLHFVPKIVAMVASAVVLVPWIAARLVEFTQIMLGEPPF